MRQYGESEPLLHEPRRGRPRRATALAACVLAGVALASRLPGATQRLSILRELEPSSGPGVAPVPMATPAPILAPTPLIVVPAEPSAAPIAKPSAAPSAKPTASAAPTHSGAPTIPAPCTIAWGCEQPERFPNIVFLLIDDMGFNDMGYQSTDMEPFTPTMNNLAAEGIKLSNYYSQSACTPSRAALLTGVYPTSSGMFHSTVTSDTPIGVPLHLVMLPQYLKRAANYSTHAVGKWDVGHFTDHFLPHNRGFDTFFGYYGAFVSYFSYVDGFGACMDPLCFYDMHDGPDYVAAGNENGEYSTYLFSNRVNRIIMEHGKKRRMARKHRPAVPDLSAELAARALEADDEERASNQTVSSLPGVVTNWSHTHHWNWKHSSDPSPTPLPTIRTPPPTSHPTAAPSAHPTAAPSPPPTSSPSTVLPTTASPSAVPTTATPMPTPEPTTAVPTSVPTSMPTIKPTRRPRPAPSMPPTLSPTTPEPSSVPSYAPTMVPVPLPTPVPSTLHPTMSPTTKARKMKTALRAPTPTPTTPAPTPFPSYEPSSEPTRDAFELPGGSDDAGTPLNNTGLEEIPGNSEYVPLFVCVAGDEAAYGRGPLSRLARSRAIKPGTSRRRRSTDPSLRPRTSWTRTRSSSRWCPTRRGERSRRC